MAKRGSLGCFDIALMSTWNRTCRWNIAGAVLPRLYSTLNDIGELTLCDNSAICNDKIDRNVHSHWTLLYHYLKNLSFYDRAQVSDIIIIYRDRYAYR